MTILFPSSYQVFSTKLIGIRLQPQQACDPGLVLQLSEQTSVPTVESPGSWQAVRAAHGYLLCYPPNQLTQDATPPSDLRQMLQKTSLCQSSSWLVVVPFSEWGDADRLTFQWTVNGFLDGCPPSLEHRCCWRLLNCIDYQCWISSY